MLYKTFLWINLIILTNVSVCLAQAKIAASEVKKWVVCQSSSLCVNGSTNINNFACDVPAYDQTDTLFLTKSKAGKEIILSGMVGLKVQGFDCHNSIMTRDLRNTLKEKQFPKLLIRFVSLSELPELCATAKAITGIVNIEIAGTVKRVEVNYTVSVDAQKVIHLLGWRDVNFSDFNLTPPRKLGGMIQTRDKLSVVFHLKIKPIEP